MRDYQDALQTARELAKERFPEGEYTVKTLVWADGDFRVMVRHGMGQAGGEEVTDSEQYTVHKEKDI